MNFNFKNPYNFVKIDWSKKPEKKYPLTYEKFKGKSGRIKLKITSLSPLFIRHTYEENEKRKPDGINLPIQFAHNKKNEYFIPGSSLKGMLRATAEAIVNSCLTVFDGSYERKKITYELKYDYFKSCRGKEICITCRVFGMQSKSASFKGKINVSDAKCKTPIRFYKDVILPILSTPKPHHTAFYSDPSEKGKNIIAGRKFYYHENNVIEESEIKYSNRTNKPYNMKIKPLDKENVFYGTVDFENLTEEELSLLIYAIVLEDGMCHKIGMGKPVGFGSIKVEIENIEFYNFLDRLLLRRELVEKCEGESLEHYIKTKTKLFRENKDINLESLRKIWKYPPEKDIIYKYPERDWFKRNSNVTLKELNGE